ncbi:MAG TPA: CGNR zinc finger domain-containing protein, partial [Longimicrobiaceae bacterium]|nr:CGNR zinc finger domain-containing protein [Longimicrobiaceae bacterium]
AVELREAIYGIFSTLAGGGEAPQEELEILNRELSRAMSRARITAAGGQCDWAWQDTGELDRVLWPVARSAAQLLTSEDRVRVKECAGDDCGWLYLDTSKNRSRRWCDMKDCGNRAKVRRHYHRHRAGEGD